MKRTSNLTAEPEQKLQEWITAAVGLVAFCLLAIIAMSELASRNHLMAGFYLAGAGLCIVNAVAAVRFGLIKWLVRASIFYILVVLLAEIGHQHLSSPMIYALLIPFVFTFLLGNSEAMIWSLLTCVAGVSAYSYGWSPGSAAVEIAPLELLLLFCLSVATALGYERIRAKLLLQARSERERLQEEIDQKNAIAERNQGLLADLSQALREVRELTGLIPMCASCKKIRGDEDFWEHVEAYLHKRTRLEFSHGLCPECSDDALDEIEHFERKVTE